MKLHPAFQKRPARKRVPRKRPFLKHWWLLLKYKLLRLSGDPKQIAIGLAWGCAVSFSPLYGTHIPLAVALTLWMRGNLLAAGIGTLVGNPLTSPLIFWLDYHVGHVVLNLLGYDLPHKAATEQLMDIRYLLDNGLHILVPMLVGYGILMIGSYPLFYRLFVPLARYLQHKRTRDRQAGYHRRKAAKERQS